MMPIDKLVECLGIALYCLVYVHIIRNHLIPALSVSCLVCCITIDFPSFFSKGQIVHKNRDVVSFVALELIFLQLFYFFPFLKMENGNREPIFCITINFLVNATDYSVQQSVLTRYF